MNRICRSHLKNRILVQGQGGAEVQPAGILKYSEELKRGLNTEIGTKDIFEIASKLHTCPAFAVTTPSQPETPFQRSFLRRG
jgi:hypothetical protein